MMRGLYSGVAGLKTHQTKMDVIGNNIANVNTVGFKSSSVNFSDTFYQMISSATGPNAELATAGINAKQIGLGSMVASITTNITEQGGPSTTNRALDVAINGESFLIVRSGTETVFTKSGALNVDPSGNLYCTTNNATVQGWMADDNGVIIKDRVKDLVVMSPDKMYYQPEATTAVTMSGNIDPNDPKLTSAEGVVMTASFYDNLGNSYTIQMSVKQKMDKDATTGVETPVESQYEVSVTDVLDTNGKSIFVTETNGTYSASGAQIKFGSSDIEVDTAKGVNPLTGEFELTSTGDPIDLIFDTVTGNFAYLDATGVGANEKYDVSYTPKDSNGADGTAVTGKKAIGFSITNLHGAGNAPEGGQTPFPQYKPDADDDGIHIFFDSITQYSKGGTSKVSYARGDASVTSGNDGAGYKAGKMTGLSIDDQGKIWGNYDNGLQKCLAQMAVATFANPSGLESAGNSLFRATLNSGEFDGVGEEIKTSGGSFTVGALEMSNVDLANEFVNMITTQRGFQANSRIITTSDSMLEELVNLKR